MPRKLMLAGFLGTVALGLPAFLMGAKPLPLVESKFKIINEKDGGGLSDAGPLQVEWTGVSSVDAEEASLVVSLLEPGGDRYDMPVLETQTLNLQAGTASAQMIEVDPDEPGQWILVTSVAIDQPGYRRVASDQLVIDVALDGTRTIGREKAVSAHDYSGGRPSYRVRDGYLAPRTEKSGAVVTELQNTLYRDYDDGSAEGESSPKYSTGSFWVKGYVRFTDRRYNSSGYTTTTTRPLRNTNVDILEVESGGDIDILGSVYTSNSGYFSFQVPNNIDGPGEGGRDISVTAYTDSKGTGQVYGVTGYLYKYQLTEKSNWGGGTLYLGTKTIPLSESAPFNILYNMDRGYKYSKNKGENPPKCYTEWYPGNTTGTHYVDSENTVYLLGKASDPDEWDDDIILHEYGHFAGKKFSYYKHPGTNPHLIGNEYTANLAWPEGWAHFFSNAVRNSRYQIDVSSGGTSFTDFETAAWGPLGDDCEGTVAAVLHDIWDSRSDYPDYLSGGSSRIWTIFTTSFNLYKGCTLYDFYRGWKIKRYSDLSKVKAILDFHGVVYGSDIAVVKPDAPGDIAFRGEWYDVGWSNFNAESVVVKLLKGNSTFANLGVRKGSPGEDPVVRGVQIPESSIPDDNYRLRVELQSNPSVAVFSPPLEIVAAPRTLTVNGAQLIGGISVGGEEDWYKIVISTSGYYKIQTFEGTLNDTYMYLYGKNSPTKLIKTDDDSGLGYMSKIVRYLYPGTYYIKIRAYSGSQTGTYSIRVTK